MGTVVTIIAGIISVVAYLQGGPEQVVQTFTVIVEAPAQVVNIDVSAIVDRLDKILALAEDFYDSPEQDDDAYARYHISLCVFKQGIRIANDS